MGLLSQWLNLLERGPIEGIDRSARNGLSCIPLLRGDRSIARSERSIRGVYSGAQSIQKFRIVMGATDRIDVDKGDRDVGMRFGHKSRAVRDLG